MMKVVKMVTLTSWLERSKITETPQGGGQSGGGVGLTEEVETMSKEEFKPE